MVTGGMAPNPEGGVFPGAAGIYTAQDSANHRVVTERVHAAGGLVEVGRFSHGAQRQRRRLWRFWRR